MGDQRNVQSSHVSQTPRRSSPRLKRVHSPDPTSPVGAKRVAQIIGTDDDSEAQSLPRRSPRLKKIHQSPGRRQSPGPKRACRNLEETLGLDNASGSSSSRSSKRKRSIISNNFGVVARKKKTFCLWSRCLWALCNLQL